jgi:hypothetical protein
LNKFTVITADSFIWNQLELVDFLVKNQGGAISIDTRTEGASCQAVGLYDVLDKFNFKHVEIHSGNCIEQHSKYSIKVQSLLQWAHVRKPVDSKYHMWNHDKIFLAYYGRPIWHRLGIVAHLVSQYPAISSVNLRGDYNNEDSRKLFELTELFTNAPAKIKTFSSIADSLPLMLEKQDGYTPGQEDTSGFTDQLLDFYPNILIDIVSESYTSGDTFCPTEKTFRPMLMKKPFIIMGPKNHLIYLRQLGFRTFHDFWDEDYDGHSPTMRFQCIIELVDKLATKSKNELDDMYHKMQSILDHNYNLLINCEYSRKIALVKD